MDEAGTAGDTSTDGNLLMGGTISQPVRIAFEISKVLVGGEGVSVTERDILVKPFCVLTEFSHSRSETLPRIFVIAPLSGHYSLMLRDFVIGLLRHYRVYVTNWISARHIPPTQGRFGFDENIDYILEMVRFLGPGVNVVALCQAVVPTLAAAAVLSKQRSQQTMRSLILMGGPINPLANPTRVVRLLRMHELKWFEENTLQSVSSSFAGYKRLVYPGSFQLAGLMAYLTRHMWQRGELFYKVSSDDGADTARFPFIKLYTSVMDLPAEFFLENIRACFHQCDIFSGTLRWHGTQVDPTVITETALMTIEGRDDDIAAPGQTRVAHDLCSQIADTARCHLTVEDCGHFSLFHGQTWRMRVLPNIVSFLNNVHACC